MTQSRRKTILDVEFFQTGNCLAPLHSHNSHRDSKIRTTTICPELSNLEFLLILDCILLMKKTHLNFHIKHCPTAYTLCKFLLAKLKIQIQGVIYIAIVPLFSSIHKLTSGASTPDRPLPDQCLP